MTGINHLLPFATGVGANVEDPALWQTDNARLQGFQSGIASSQKVNTALRQAAFTSAMIGQFTAAFANADVLDDGNVTEYENNFIAALGAAIQSLIPQGLLYSGNDTGTANNVQVTSVVPSLGTWTAGKSILIHKGAAPNSGATNVTVLGVTRPVTWPDGTALSNGQWPASSEVLLFDDGTHFQLLTFTGPNMLTQLGAGEGITTAGNAISFYYTSLLLNDTVADADLFVFWSFADQHHRKTSWGNLIAKILARIPTPDPGQPYVQYPGLGTGVGQQLLQMWDIANSSTPDTYGLAIGMNVSAANLQAGNVQAAGNPLDPYQGAINNNTVPAYNGFGVHNGFWASWPGLTGTWRLDAWFEIAGFAFGFGYPFLFVWRRIA